MTNVTFAQTLFLPNGATGIGPSLNSHVGIGTNNPRVRFQVNGPSGMQSRLRINSPVVGSEARFDVTMGTADDNLGGGMRVYVPLGQPGVDRIFVGFYTTTYVNGLQARVERMTITDRGHVGIGTTNPGEFKLAVEGKVGAREINVTLSNPWPDYVFENEYKLMSLTELGRYIDENGHLPEIPTAKQIAESGLDVGEMNVLLLKKIEELTLYVLELKKEIDSNTRN